MDLRDVMTVGAIHGRAYVNSFIIAINPIIRRRIVNIVVVVYNTVK